MTNEERDFVLEQFDQSSEEMKRGIVVRFAEKLFRLEMLLARKNKALSLFADLKMWWAEMSIGKNPFWIWNGDGDGAYRNPVEFAKREMETDD